MFIGAGLLFAALIGYLAFSGDSPDSPSDLPPEAGSPTEERKEPESGEGVDLSDVDAFVRKLKLQPELLETRGTASQICEFDENVESGYIEGFLESFHSEIPGLKGMEFTVLILERLRDPLRRLSLAKKHLSGGPLHEAIVDTYSWYVLNNPEAAFSDYAQFPPGQYQGLVLAEAMKSPISASDDVQFRIDILAKADPATSKPASLALGGAVAKAYNKGTVSRSEIEALRSTWDKRVDMAFLAEANEW